MSPIRNDLSDLPKGGDSEGFPPVANPVIVSRLAQAWYAQYLGDGNDSLAMAIEGARWRASWSGMCARKVGYEIVHADAERVWERSVPGAVDFTTKKNAAALREAVESSAPTDPHTIADAWRFGLGSMVHSALQDVIVKAFPEAEAEVRIKIDDFGAAHADLVMEFDNEEDFLNGRTARIVASTPDEASGPDRGLLDLDGGDQQADGVRSDRSGSNRGGSRVDASGDVGDVARTADPVRAGDRPPVQGESVLQPGTPRSGDARGEQRAGHERQRDTHAQDPLSAGSPLRQEAPTQGREGEDVLGSGVLDLQPQDQPRVDGAVPRTTFRVLCELKTCNGFFWKLAATNFKGAPEGPRSSAIAQGAVAARAIDADLLVIGFLSLECLSPDVAARAGMDEVGRFSGEWHLAREEFEPIAEQEIKRVRRIITLIDEGSLPPRHVPEIPAKARITDPTRSAWTLQDDSGAIVMAGELWNGQFCRSYCNHFSRCLGDGPS